MDQHYGNALESPSVLHQFHIALAKVKDAANMTSRELETLASHFEHLNTEMVCYLTQKALGITTHCELQRRDA